MSAPLQLALDIPAPPAGECLACRTVGRLEVVTLSRWRPDRPGGYCRRCWSAVAEGRRVEILRMGSA